MNCFNGEQFLNESINSVINQEYQNWELIFWDNKSTDKSSDIVSSYSDLRIKYFLSDDFTSLGQARNLAISKASGEYIGFLDTDDLWFEDKLKLQIPKFLYDKDVGIVICNTIFFNKHREKVYYKTPPKQGYVFRNLLKSYYISLETVLIRKDSLSNLNYFFSENYNIIEEFDFLVRLSKHVKLSYVNKVLSKWRIHPNSLTWEKKYLYPIELESFINNLIATNPNFEEEYDSEINFLKRKINLKKIQLAIQNNDRKSAFLIVKMIKPLYFRFLIFIIILLPHFFLRLILKLSGRLST